MELVESGAINAKPENVNGASIDITLGSTILLEQCIYPNPIIDPTKESLNLFEVDITKGFPLPAGSCALANSVEVFNLPNGIASDYKIKSSMGRVFLNSMLAGWCDPTWNNSTLTLELKNETEYHSILLSPGMKIGQMVFWEGEPIPESKTYAVRGQYNRQGDKPVKNGGIR